MERRQKPEFHSRRQPPCLELALINRGGGRGQRVLRIKRNDERLHHPRARQFFHSLGNRRISVTHGWLHHPRTAQLSFETFGQIKMVHHQRGAAIRPNFAIKRGRSGRTARKDNQVNQHPTPDGPNVDHIGIHEKFTQVSTDLGRRRPHARRPFGSAQIDQKQAFCAHGVIHSGRRRSTQACVFTGAAGCPF